MQIYMQFTNPVSSFRCLVVVHANASVLRYFIGGSYVTNGLEIA